MTQSPSLEKPDLLESQKVQLVAVVYRDHDVVSDQIQLGDRLPNGQISAKVLIFLVEDLPAIAVMPGAQRVYVDPKEFLVLAAMYSLAARIAKPSGQELRDCLLAPDRIKTFVSSIAEVEVIVA